jgi:integrase
VFSVYGKTEREAIQKKRDLIRRHEDGRTLGTCTQTVAQFLERWLADVASLTTKPSTLKTYSTRVHCYLIPHLGSIQLGKLTAQHVQDMVGKMQAKSQPKPLSPRTIHCTVEVLGQALNYAIKADLLMRNVTKAVTLPRLNEPERNVLSFEEAYHFLSVVDAHPIARERAALYHLAIILGIRQGELLGLEWSDIDFSQRTLTIKGDLKTDAAHRTLPLSENLIRVLRQRQHYQMEQQLAATRWHRSDLVFTTQYGTRIDPNNIRLQFARLLKKAELPKMRFHELRHTAATLMARVGIPVGEVQRILGHKHIRTTLETYTHYAPHDLARAVDSVTDRIHQHSA